MHMEEMHMENEIKATEAVRGFSELLNNIKFKGHHYTILRGGKPVALIGPAKPYPEKLCLKALKKLLEEIPSLGDEAEAFAMDIDAIIGCQPVLPGEDRWE
jgi:antitoxin (DNA-binding transcriptional repressor) of toxin-antitoxin stability system